MNLLEALGFPADAWQSVAQWLRLNYLLNQTESERIRATRDRKQLLMDVGEKVMEPLITKAFKDPVNQRAHRDLLPFTKWDNAIRRIHGESATLYVDAPKRWVKNGNELYQRLLKDIRQDEIMRRANLWLHAFNDVLLWFRVRELEPARVSVDAEGNVQEMPAVLEPVLEVLSPDQFWAVAHPDDATHLLAIVKHIAPRDGNLEKPHFDVWTNTERIKINGNFVAMVNTRQDNPFKRIPGVFVHKEPRDTCLFDWQSGGDVVAGQQMAWLMNAILVQEAKSISKQAVWIGDAASIPTGQAQRTEIDLHAPEGTGFTTIDRGVDIRQFRDTADHVIERPAANHGLPPSVLRHDTASSGFEITLRERRLKELRTQDTSTFRTAERDLVEIQDVVLGEAIPSAHFPIDGWGIDYGERDIPLSPKEGLEVFEERRRLGLTSTIAYLREKDPDLLDDDSAADKIKGYIDAEVDRNEWMRPLQKISGSMNTPADGNELARANGAQGPAVRDGKPTEQEVPVPGQNGKGPKVIATDVQATALNGAQVTSMVDVITKVAAGEISRESAKAIMLTAFPTVDEERAEQLLGPAEFEPRSQDPEAQPPPPPPTRLQ